MLAAGSFVLDWFTVFLLLATILFVVSAILVSPGKGQPVRAWEGVLLRLGLACFSFAFLADIWFGK